MKSPLPEVLVPGLSESAGLLEYVDSILAQQRDFFFLNIHRRRSH